MPPRLSSLVGEKYGRWTVLCSAGKNSHRQTLWTCRCECGTERNVSQVNLRTGGSKSCGCLHLEHIHERRFIHGRNGTDRTYSSWSAMRTRCLNSRSWKYARYGGRGITVCDRWNDFRLFLEDMGERPAGKTLDRWPDPNGNYEPGNCRWATPTEQMNNRAQRYKLDLLQIAYIQSHKAVPSRELAELLGVCRRTVDKFKADKMVGLSTPF